MTDTDKLKRLAEEALKYDPTGWREVAFKEPEALAILALIAERDEAVALLREIVDDPHCDVEGIKCACAAFLASMDNDKNA